jgi:hypothetical protein
MPDEPDGIRGFAEDGDGALLIGKRTGLRRFVEGKEEDYPPLGISEKFNSRRLLRDRNDSLWVATSGSGLVHVHKDKTDVFTQSDGLPGNGGD